jgi:hypothetical protein
MQITLFTPHRGQKKIIEGFANSPHLYCSVACGRQFGKSLLGQNLMLYWLLKTSNSKGAWISPIYNQSKKVFQELSDAAHKIIKSSNKADLTMTFINGSTIQFLSAERYDSIRGFSFNYMVVDECAYIKEQAMQEAIFPTLSAIGKKCLMISTPKSKNWFYTAYLKGINEGGDFISFAGKFIENPHISADFIAEQAKSLPYDIYLQEYEAQFTESGNDVFTGINLVCNLNQWDVPQRNRRYYFGVDTGLSNDFSVLTIMDESGRVAKILRDNGRSFEELAGTFIQELKKYSIHGGYIETNGVGRAMFELINKEIRKSTAFITTNDSKNKGIRNLIYKIQNGELELPDGNLFPHLKQELEAYSYKISASGTMTFNSPSGYHDDCVMSLMFANEAREKLALSKNKIYIGNMK